MDSNVTTREGQRNIGRFGHKFETSCMSIKVHDLQDYIDKLELISDEIEDLQIQEQLLERLSGVYERIHSNITKDHGFQICKKISLDKVGNFITLSSSSQTINECVEKLENRNKKTSSHAEKAKLEATKQLLLELTTSGILPLEICYQEYLARLPKEFHPKNNSRASARQAFKNTLLGHATGLPIVIVRDPNGEQYVILTEKPSDNKLFLKT